jgi:hypothetical protein
MSRLNQGILNNLVNDWPSGAVYLASWLKTHGVSNQLLDRYKKSGWVDAVGNGAVKRKGASVNYQGGLYALQTQLDSSVHVGGTSALALQGKVHYLQLGNAKVMLFGDDKERLPKWFQDGWRDEFEYFKSSFLPPQLGLVEHETKGFAIKISGPARAMMECLYLAPNKHDLQACYELMEGLTQLRPQLVQELLESCTSIKVKRLFLHMAKKSKQPWLEYVHLEKVFLGSGKRNLFKGGVYSPEYQLTLPRALI